MRSSTTTIISDTTKIECKNELSLIYKQANLKKISPDFKIKPTEFLNTVTKIFNQRQT